MGGVFLGELQPMYLVLEDGSCWEGFGPGIEAKGEVVFDTTPVGYPQAVSDPSFAGQIVVFAFPMIGNYGVDLERLESNKPWASGVVVTSMEKGAFEGPSFSEWLIENGVGWMKFVDTRRLVIHLRERGCLRGAMCLDKRKEIPLSQEEHPVKTVSTKEVIRLEGKRGPKIALVDYGVKRNIVRELQKRDCTVIIFPHNTEAEEILREDPDGILLSNGPGDPSLLEAEIKTVGDLIGQKPIAGICLGMQILALAVGGMTEKLKYGHRGANHAVKDLISGKGLVTSQNHGYAVVESSLRGTGMIVTHVNLGDGSVEGIMHERLPIWGVQFHPEGSPGPLDYECFFDKFVASTKGVL